MSNITISKEKKETGETAATKKCKFEPKLEWTVQNNSDISIVINDDIKGNLALNDDDFIKKDEKNKWVNIA